MKQLDILGSVIKEGVHYKAANRKYCKDTVSEHMYSPLIEKAFNEIDCPIILKLGTWGADFIAQCFNTNKGPVVMLANSPQINDVASVCEVLIHENTHAKQYKEGRLIYAGETYLDFEGEMYIPSLNRHDIIKQPWEVEAHEASWEWLRQNGLFPQFATNDYIWEQVRKSAELDKPIF